MRDGGIQFAVAPSCGGPRDDGWHLYSRGKTKKTIGKATTNIEKTTKNYEQLEKTRKN